VRSVEEELSEGQELEVLCNGRDARGHVKVSRKALLPAPAPDQAPSSPPPPPHAAPAETPQPLRPMTPSQRPPPAGAFWQS
jgi:hypothetical protein